MNRTLQEMARSMMQSTGLGRGSWREVFLTASSLRNRGPVRDLPSTPQEMWSGVKPNISHLRAYGCKVYCPIDKMQREGKLGLVRYVGVLVGYAEDDPSYRVWNLLKAKKVANVGGAEFDESVGKAWWRGGLGVEDLADMEVGGHPQPSQVEASRLEGVGHPI